MNTQASGISPKIPKFIGSESFRKMMKYLLPFFLFVLFAPGVVFQFPLSKDDDEQSERKYKYLFTKKSSVISGFVQAAFFTAALFILNFLLDKYCKKTNP